MSNIGVPIKEEHKAILLNGAKAAGEKTVQSFMLNAALDKAESLRLPYFPLWIKSRFYT